MKREGENVVQGKGAIVYRIVQFLMPQFRCLEERDPLPVALLVQEFLPEEESEGGGSGWKLPAEDEASFDRPALGKCGIDLQDE